MYYGLPQTHLGGLSQAERVTGPTIRGSEAEKTGTYRLSTRSCGGKMTGIVYVISAPSYVTEI